MVSEEIKQTILISVSAILLASLLGFVAFLMMLRSDFASARNSEVYSTQNMSNFREFSKFDGSVLFGEDVAAAVRDYYDSDIKIRVNDPALNISPLYESISGVFNVDKYIARQTPDKVNLTNLQTWFPTTKRYKAVLVYGQVDLNTVTLAWTAAGAGVGINNNVSAIVFFYTGPR